MGNGIPFGDFVNLADYTPVNRKRVTHLLPSFPVNVPDSASGVVQVGRVAAVWILFVDTDRNDRIVNGGSIVHD